MNREDAAAVDLYRTRQQLSAALREVRQLRAALEAAQRRIAHLEGLSTVDIKRAA